MTSWFRSLFSKKSDQKSAYPVVWDASLTPVYQQLLPWRGESGPLPENLRELPDAKPRNDNEIGWSDGALDGIFSHHMGGNDDTAIQEICDLLKAAAEKGDADSISALLATIRDESPLGYIDKLLQQIVEQQNIHAGKLAIFSAWLAQNSPERNVVKLAMTLLVFFPEQDNIDILFVLGAHDEFTLYAIVALAAMIENPQIYEAVWLRMAKRVDGWGRVHMIERIPDSIGEPTRQWLLREGYNNAVMVEYTAWYCATRGQLAEALAAPADDALIDGATDILQALFDGGPAQDITDYDERAVCCADYLAQLTQREPSLAHYCLVWQIGDYVRENNHQDDTDAPLFPNADALLTQVSAILLSPRIGLLVSQHIRSSDDLLRHQAIRAARLFNIDVWPVLFEQQQQNAANNFWFSLMQTGDPQRVAQVVTLAEQQLPLDDIAAGPSDSLGFGPQWEAHGKLDFVLQELERFPDTGWPLIRSGLRSPVVRNRNMALHVLFSRPAETWPADITPLLEKAAEEEPGDALRTRIRALLKGEKDPDFHD